MCYSIFQINQIVKHVTKCVKRIFAEHARFFLNDATIITPFRKILNKRDYYVNNFLHLLYNILIVIIKSLI